jgi:hypothetical protein
MRCNVLFTIAAGNEADMLRWSITNNDEDSESRISGRSSRSLLLPS